jgi:TPR repeat protein
MWYGRAAEQGFPRAQGRLGMMYQYGRGVAHDDVAAYMWYALGASGGDATARERQEILAKRMAPVRVAEAESRANDWRETRDSIAGASRTTSASDLEDRLPD